MLKSLRTVDDTEDRQPVTLLHQANDLRYINEIGRISRNQADAEIEESKR